MLDGVASARQRDTLYRQHPLSRAQRNSRRADRKARAQELGNSRAGSDAGRLADGTLDPEERAGLATGQLPLRAQRTCLRAFASSDRPPSTRHTLIAGSNFLEAIRVTDAATLGPSKIRRASCRECR